MAGEPAPDRGILEMAKHFYIQKGARKQEDMERRSPKTKAWNSKFGAGAGHYPPPPHGSGITALSLARIWQRIDQTDAESSHDGAEPPLLVTVARELRAGAGGW